MVLPLLIANPAVQARSAEMDDTTAEASGKVNAAVEAASSLPASAPLQEAVGLLNQLELATKLLRERDAKIGQLKKSLRTTREKVEHAESVAAVCMQLKDRITDLELQSRERAIDTDGLRAELLKTGDHLQRAKDTIADLRGQNENLKEQVRVEVERRAKLESELQSCEKACSENEALREELAEVRRTADDASRLVRSSRRLQRQQADQLLAVKTENERLLKANEEVASLEEEVETLRNLVCDKDAAMQRHIRTMEALKELIQRLRQVHPGVNESIDEFFRASTSEEDWAEEDDEFDAGTPKQRRRLLGARPKSGAVRVPSRSSPARQPRSVSVASNRSADWDRRPSQVASRASTRAETATPAAGGRSSCEPSRSASSQAGPAFSTLGKKRLDAVASLYVQLGSRVTVEVRGNPESGTVKYVGAAHPADRHNVFVGIRLHSQVGNTDGTFRGVRYFTAPSNTGLFVRAHKVLSVFNSKKNCHVGMAECIKSYLKLHQ